MTTASLQNAGSVAYQVRYPRLSHIALPSHLLADATRSNKTAAGRFYAARHGHGTPPSSVFQGSTSPFRIYEEHAEQAKKPRRLSFYKCVSCRKDKKKCVFENDATDSTCKRCKQTGHVCSPPVRVDAHRKGVVQDGHVPLPHPHVNRSVSPATHQLPKVIQTPPAEPLTTGSRLPAGTLASNPPPLLQAVDSRLPPAVDLGQPPAVDSRLPPAIDSRLPQAVDPRLSQVVDSRLLQAADSRPVPPARTEQQRSTTSSRPLNPQGYPPPEASSNPPPSGLVPQSSRHISETAPIPASSSRARRRTTPPEARNITASGTTRKRGATGHDSPRIRKRQRQVDPHQDAREDADGGPNEETNWACPFYKLDPVRHYRCAGKYQLRRLFDVKQHLRRCHTINASNCCSKCRAVSQSRELFEDHIRDGSCREAPRSEGLLVEELDMLKLRHSDDDKSKWFDLWHQLFDDDPPDSPFIKEGLAEPLALIGHSLQEALNSHLATFLSSHRGSFSEANISHLSDDILASIRNSVTAP
ncbi:hypothetical protein G7Z17_g846 [Cylindrodendrum hubeiense]|uniref:Zn(2)-C6 fungal-type domain-containing protein n=1 Tax=Cylindrodendrum hubeiense TaxID=595255 RepID=A0A9P5HKQ9_9HYPO|nr:hypothetical protein G7Z17_g846 [Cylindrodendrum hubeiense]